ncbi:ERF family protein [Streptococcus anginosus]|nr:ERF family protein [Streptococcus anginosus]MED5952538.1 ERF family protein [Streptococcus anginosus]MED5956569.1 ERF family protein [Streptococcus anginosus]
MVTKQQSAIFVALQSIQQQLIAPKGQYNSFGKYAYRSAEDIWEALKPILQAHDATLILQDDIEQIGDRYYVCATATLYAMGETIGTRAYAREDETKKGMDGSQITGAASSYARKYALNGLFMIDDNKDADSDEYNSQAANPAKTEKTQKTAKKTSDNSQKQTPAKNVKRITGAQAKKLREDIKNIAEASGSPVNTVGIWFIGRLGVDKIENIPAEDLKKAQELIAETKKVKGIE